MSNWWKDFITKLLLLFAAFKVIWNIVAIIQGYLNIDNPLIPDYLGHYIAFPLYFLIAIWAVCFIICFQLIKNKDRLEKWFYPVLIIMVLYQFFEIYVYQFLTSINPYG
jgi:hypothetical protein